MTSARDIGLLVLLAALFFWPDTLFGYHMVTGFPAVGFKFKFKFKRVTS